MWDIHERQRLRRAAAGSEREPITSEHRLNTEIIIDKAAT